MVQAFGLRNSLQMAPIFFPNSHSFLSRMVLRKRAFGTKQTLLPSKKKQHNILSFRDLWCPRNQRGQRRGSILRRFGANGIEMSDVAYRQGIFLFEDQPLVCRKCLLRLEWGILLSHGTCHLGCCIGRRDHCQLPLARMALDKGPTATELGGFLQFNLHMSALPWVFKVERSNLHHPSLLPKRNPWCARSTNSSRTIQLYF